MSPIFYNPPVKRWNLYSSPWIRALIAWPVEYDLNLGACTFSLSRCLHFGMQPPTWGEIQTPKKGLRQQAEPTVRHMNEAFEMTEVQGTVWLEPYEKPQVRTIIWGKSPESWEMIITVVALSNCGLEWPILQHQVAVFFWKKI